VPDVDPGPRLWISRGGEEKLIAPLEAFPAAGEGRESCLDAGFSHRWASPTACSQTRKPGQGCNGVDVGATARRAGGLRTDETGLVLKERTKPSAISLPGPALGPGDTLGQIWPCRSVVHFPLALVTTCPERRFAGCGAGPRAVGAVSNPSSRWAGPGSQGRPWCVGSRGPLPMPSKR